MADQTLYLLSGGGDGSDWVRNLQTEPAVSVRLRDTTYAGTAHVVAAGTPEDEEGRRLVFEKYRPRYSGGLDDWRVRALVVAIELVPGG